MHRHASANKSNLVPSIQAASAEALRRCCAELSNDLLDEEGLVIEQLIDFAFDTLGARTLDMRVTTAMHSQLMITVQDAPLSSQL
jgi:hypothetical protein